MADKKYICENGHEFNTPERVEDSTDVCYCCPVEGCTAGQNFRLSSDAKWQDYVKTCSCSACQTFRGVKKIVTQEFTELH